MAVKNAEKIMVFEWKVIDVYAGVLHKKPPSLIINQIPFIWHAE